jgi:choice-of-anchor A domain-containing protein
MTSGTLTLTGSTLVKGNVNISAVSTFSNGADIVNHLTIAPSVVIDGNLTLQNLPPNEGGVVCGSTLSGGLTLNNNQSSIQIGQDPLPATQNCPGNTIAGGLSCTANPPAILPTGGANNLVSGQVSSQCAFLIGP